MVGSSIVTRFAPSPTGALHIGGARTALYNWAFARKHGGRFILRMEDTDQMRSSQQSRQSIIDNLQWLGLNWDQGPILQSQRLELYDEHVNRLLESNRAREEEGAVRFRVEGPVAFDDAVYGHIKVDGIEDFIIRKSDGFPTFHLAVVVDDALMGVTHVIRGQEHLTNTLKHVALQDALDFNPPIYAHTPSILNPDGSKMSKRDKTKVIRQAINEWLKFPGHTVSALSDIAGVPKPQIELLMDKQNDHEGAARIAKSLNLTLPEIDVVDFERGGYLPNVLCNYISLLGWNPGNDIERFDFDYFVKHFSLERINKSNAQFDRQKLYRFNKEALADLSLDNFAAKLETHLSKYYPQFFGRLKTQFSQFAEVYQRRSGTTSEPAIAGWFFGATDENLRYDAKAIDKFLAKHTGEGFAVLAELRKTLASLNAWTASDINAAICDYADQKQINMKKVAQPLRVAVSGGSVSPPIDQTLFILGKVSTLARIDQCLQLQPHTNTNPCK